MYIISVSVKKKKNSEHREYDNQQRGRKNTNSDRNTRYGVERRVVRS